VIVGFRSHDFLKSLPEANRGGINTHGGDTTRIFFHALVNRF